MKDVVIMSVQNQVKGVTSLVGGKGHRLVKAKVIQQRRQTDSKRIGGGINMNVEISDDEEAAFHGVAVFKEVGEFLEEKRVGKLVLFVGRWTIQTEEL
ncbi:hypothetical protein [Thiolapillus sp.]|uniref:hypothetical protein n=5 Tax=Thiolapillus sp. TaxID=2017437 RepID=UPI003AF70AF1